MRLCVKVKFLVRGTTGTVWEWLDGTYDVSAEQLAQWMFEMVPEELRK